MLTYLATAFALSMDAFAVSLSSGICVQGLRRRHALRASLSFGFFQFAMPVAGFFLGAGFRGAIGAFDHWIAFGLLAVIGAKMLFESFEVKDETTCTEEELAKKDIRNFRTLLVLSVATSVDALAVGVSYSLIGAPVWLAAGIIGAVTFAVCLAGFEAGRKLGARLGDRFERAAEILGGAVLVLIGFRILLSHLSGAS